MSILYLAGIILAVFFAFVLITKTNKTSADYILAGWLLAAAYPLFSYYLVVSGEYLHYPSLMVIGFSFPLLQGAFLFLYTTYQTSSDPFRKRSLVHFLPFLLSITVLFGEFHLQSFNGKIALLEIDHLNAFDLQFRINILVVYVSWLIYVLLSVRILLKYKKNLQHQFSNTDRINFNWLMYLIIGMSIVWVIILFVQEDKFIFGASALFILWLGYFGVKQVKVFNQTIMLNSDSVMQQSNEAAVENKQNTSTSHSESATPETLTDRPVKYTKSTLTDSDQTLIHQNLLRILNEQKIYKKADLTLAELAKHLNIHPNHLSQVINSKENKNFYDLINEKRIEEFLNHAKHPLNKNYTFISLAFDCGFNSKASFNRNFKKYTGKTPSDYLNADE